MTPFIQDLLSLCVALALGAFIGIEREFSDKPAGLRTNILICVGACLFTLTSVRVFDVRDAHIPAQILAGVGFLGAGAIMREGEHVTGLTTAATIWIVAAIGMTVGFQNYSIAAFAALVVLVVQVVFSRLDSRIDALRERHTFRIVSDLDDDGLERIKAIFRDAGVNILSRKLMKKSGFYYSEWHVSGPHLKQKNVVGLLLDDARVRELTY